MAYNQTARSIQEWLRVRVKRDTRLWRCLTVTKSAWFATLARIQARRWASREQQFTALLQQRAGRVPDFFFVQIGAHDGSMDDPIGRWIQKHQWQGIFVEPQRDQFERLRARYDNLRSGLIFENVAIDHREGFRPLFKVAPRVISTPEQTGLASFFPDRSPPPIRIKGEITSETVRCLPLSTLLQKHHVKRIDLLQIDTEGYDFEIIKMIDFRACAPAIIHYEHRHLSWQEHAGLPPVVADSWIQAHRKAVR